eukprot:scaffold177994_cov15-Tisochrysis_lutea.AAC.2
MAASACFLGHKKGTLCCVRTFSLSLKVRWITSSPKAIEQPSEVCTTLQHNKADPVFPLEWHLCFIAWASTTSGVARCNLQHQWLQQGNDHQP